VRSAATTRENGSASERFDLTRRGARAERRAAKAAIADPMLNDRLDDLVFAG
jgi:hypothetical protein